MLGYLPNLLGFVSMMDTDPYDDHACEGLPMDNALEEEDEKEHVSARSDITMGDGTAW